MSSTTMDARRNLLDSLSALRSDVLLGMMSDEAISQLASIYFNSTSGANDDPLHDNSMIPVAVDQANDTAIDRAKRPLNAFMAFRSYYVKIFPDVQQKTASGFLTSLWHKDPFRNKWAVIAKVYSFVRDQLGKDKVPLAQFLQLACPIMGVLAPSVYLSALGWSVQEDDMTSLQLVQGESHMTPDLLAFVSSEVPSSDIELLSALVGVGYFPGHGMGLIERMRLNSNGIMTTHATRKSSGNMYPVAKLDFIDTIRNDPLQATKELLGDHFDDSIQLLGVRSHFVGDVNSIAHLTMEPQYQDPQDFYEYSVSHTGLGEGGPNDHTMNFEGLSQEETYDIDSPFDLDEILGYTESEGKRTAHLEPSPRRNPLADFHLTF
ncbi:hypothetical protein HIM_01477 [Hirsutella minnesotensis 3608]|nr:hypothetical protein HIM_01477 [Hirsutella minnesotensis 3608]